MTPPDWAWPLIAVACLLLVGWWDSRRILRKAKPLAEAEARENAAPLGNAERLW